MKIEILYPELCNLNGDMGNIRYLKKCVPEIEILETTINEKPKFIDQGDISLVYMGTSTEKSQEIIIEKLKPYTEQIKQKIDNNQLFLFLGNSLEILGKYIENEDGSKIEGLGIFDVYAKRDMMHRHNSLCIGKFEDIEVVGFKSQFTMMYGNNNDSYFLEVEKGIGINPESKLEGIKDHNFFGTYLTGPILILNPYFTKKLLKLMGAEDTTLAFEESSIEAYKIRLEEFKRVPYQK